MLRPRCGWRTLRSFLVCQAGSIPRALMTASKKAFPGGTMRGKPRAYALAAMLGLWTGAVAPTALRAQESTVHAPVEVDMQWAVKIPMRDGISLNAPVFGPKAQGDPPP